jgi:hypothetical protein
MSLELIEDLGMVKDSGGTTRRWCLAKCSYCGEVSKHRTQSLKNKKSCGCASSELKSIASTKHGGHKDRLYHTWTDMKTRCNNPKNKRYHRYGGRGIKVCDEWLSFEPFKEWALSNGYTDEMTIDRIDNDGNYEPNNCEWVTIQENLRRRNRSNGWKSN